MRNKTFEDILKFNTAENWRDWLLRFAVVGLQPSLEQISIWPSIRVAFEHNSTTKKDGGAEWKNSANADKIFLKRMSSNKQKVAIIFPPAARDPNGEVEVWFITDKGTREEEAGGATRKFPRDKLADEKFLQSVIDWLKEQKKPSF